MLEIKNIHSGYGESMVLQGLNLRVEEGQLVTVMGSNGVGKSTLLRTVLGMLKPKSGSIAYRSKDITREPIYVRAQAGLGYVPQGRDIFPFLSVEQNLVLGLEARNLKKTVIEQKIESALTLFPALKKLRLRRGGDLSGGQQQILAIARVLLCEPSLLILDEPSEGIQPSIVDEISDALGAIKAQGVSILLVEQFPDFALTHADYYYLMQHGVLTEHGSVTSANREQIKSSINI